MKTLNDEILLKRLKSGDDKAFVEIYNKYAPFLFLDASYCLNNPDVGRDIVQELFTQLWQRKNLQKLNLENACLKTYLKKSIKFLCYRYNTKEINSKKRELIFQENLDTVSVIEEVVVKTKLPLKNYFATLTKRRREVMEKIYLEGKDREEVAAELDITDETLRKRIWNSINILRTRIQLQTT